MFRYERVNSTSKFTIVAEIVSLLRKIYEREAPFRAVFDVKTLVILFPPYPREMKTNTRNLNLPPFWRLFVYGNGATHSHARSITRAWLKHARSFDLCGSSYPIFIRCSGIEPARERAAEIPRKSSLQRDERCMRTSSYSWAMC